MKLEPATTAVLPLIGADLARAGLADALDPTSPDGDPGKFRLAGRPARVIYHHDAYYLNVNLAWFDGVDAPASIKGGPVEFYVFVIPGPVVRYWICPWRQLMGLAREFTGPTRERYRSTLRWRAVLRALRDLPDAVLFYWADENVEEQRRHGWRIVDLDNAVAAVGQELHRRAGHPGRFAAGGEGEAHRRLKLFIAGHPELVGASARAVPRVEYQFATGDRVDLIFENHHPERTVAEVEVEGRDNLLIGVQQAVKYAALAGVERRAPLVSPRVRAHVVAYRTHYPEVAELAGAYGVNLVAVEAPIILAA